MSDTQNDQTETEATEAPTTGPDFDNPSSVTAWYGQVILETYGKMVSARTKAETRLRVVGQALDSWQRLYKVAAETSELSDLRRELDELRAQIEAERRSGPTGVVKQ